MTTPEEPRDELPDRAAESPADDLAAPSPTASDDAGPNVGGASSPGPGVAEPDAADSAAVDPADAAANDAAPAAAAGVTRNLPPGAVVDDCRRCAVRAVAARSMREIGQAAESRSRTARTWGQRALLVLNCIVITACFVGAGALLVARHYANNVHKVDLPSASPSSDPIATSDAVVSVATSTAPRDTSAGVPVSTVVGDTAPVATGSTAPPETFPPAIRRPRTSSSPAPTTTRASNPTPPTQGVRRPGSHGRAQRHHHGDAHRPGEHEGCDPVVPA
jgi:hypothetical protein